MQLSFDSFGWWSSDSIKQLQQFRDAGNVEGWYGVSSPPEQIPYFVTGANTAEKAIARGMPVETANGGKLTTPVTLLD